MKPTQQEPRKPRLSEVILIGCISFAVAAFGVFIILQERSVGKTRQGSIVISEGWPAIWNGVFFLGFAMIMLSIVLPKRIRSWVLALGTVTAIGSVVLALV